jgi:6-phosphogluconolactonase
MQRRRFLQGASALAVPMLSRARQKPPKSSGPILVYAGTYGNNVHGITLFEMSPSTGALTQRELFPDIASPVWLAFDPAKTHLYATNEISDFQGSKSGSVCAFSIDRSNGHLTLLNTVSSHGAGPAHMSVHPSGKYALVANYPGGTVAVLSILPNGELGPATDVQENHGAIGPTHAASAPPGSFAISGHDGPHPHMFQSDPSGRFVLATDLGMDRIFIWEFDVNSGKLGNPTSVALPPGDGPRHFAFHPNGRWMYSLQEEGSTLVSFDFDGASGKLTAKQTISSLPKGFAGSNFTSEVMVSFDGRFVYAANRLHDTIAYFAISGAGALTLTGEEWTRGDYPSHFNIDPSGNFLYVSNQKSDAITTFRVNRKTGRLAFTGNYTPVSAPARMVFLG